MTPEEGHWNEAQRRLKIGRELHTEICRVFPDEGNEGMRRVKSAAWRSLLDALEMIEHNPLREFRDDWDRAHWAGRIEVAMRIISGVEMAMYDPRSHPERYGTHSKACRRNNGDAS